MKKRILSLLLVVLMFVSAIPVASTYASDNADELSLWLVDDSGAEQPAEDVALYRGGAVRLAAHRGAAVSGGLQWQIASGDEWINIQGATADTLRVSYGMVAPLLADGAARLRCTVGEVESEAVTIRVTEENPAPAARAETLSAPEPLPAPVATVVESAPEPTPETDPVPEAEPTPETDPAPESEPTPEAEPTPETETETETETEPTGEEGIATMALDGDNGPALTVPSAKTYTVTIYYVYSDGSQFKDRNVAQPYVAQYAEGATVTLDVASPNCIGYTPSETTFNKTIENLTNDQVYYVYYSPAQVSYSVRHYLQNVDDDEYTLDTTTVVSGYTEAMTEDTAAQKDYVGFTALSHVNEQIAADGSTIVDIYYDRNYYMFTFDLDGGYGVEPVYARYGAPISVGTPTKAGYGFAGWTDATATTATDTVPLPATMPAENRRYKATWTAGTASFTVVYWLQNPNDEKKYDYRLAKTYTNMSLSQAYYISDYSSFEEAFKDDTTVTLDQYAVRYSTYNKEKTLEANGGETFTIAGDGSTVVNVYYDRMVFTLKFYYAISTESTSTDTGTGTDTDTGTGTDTDTKRDYYVVGGSTYYFGANAGISDQEKGNEIDLLNQYVTTYSSLTGQVQTAPTLNAKGKERSYTTDFDKSTVNNTEYRYHYISFQARYGQDISELWPCDVFNSVDRVEDYNHNNQWTSKTAVVSAWNGEHHVYYSQKAYAEATDKMMANQTIKGKYSELDYQLLWDNYYNAYDKPKDMTVSYLCFWENGAKVNWSIPRLRRYQIWVEPYPGQDLKDMDKDKKITSENGTILYYLYDSYDTCDDSDLAGQTQPAINGFTAYGKPGQGELGNPNNTVYQSAMAVNFYYKRNQYDLTFMNGETAEKKVMAYYGQDITKLAPVGSTLTHYDSAKAQSGGYEFDHWGISPDGIEGDSLADMATMPNSKLTLYANWKAKAYTVNVYSDSGMTTTLRDAQTVAYNRLAEAPESEPTKENQTFLGWFYKDAEGDEHAFSFESTPITKNMDIYAKWRSTQTCPITVKYVLVGENGQPVLDADGNEILVAKTETQKLPVGQLRTYNAKTGTALYPACREGYFPTVASQSITPTEDMVENGSTVVFKYRQYTAVPYKVRFVIADENGDETPAFVQKDGKIVFAPSLAATATGYEEYTEEHNDNKMSIVTELYVPEAMLTGTWTLPEGYVPDAIQKQLIVVPGESGPENEANTIKFVYRLTSGQARYSVNQYVQNADGNGYTQYKHEDFLASIGSTVSASPITIAGYEFSASVTDEKKAADVTRSTENALSGTVAKDHSLELNFYYDAIEYPYQIMYLEQGSNQVLKAPKTTDDSGNALKARYGTTVTATADAIDNYTPVKESESIVIQQEAKNEAGAYVVSQNIIYLYYKPVSGGLSLSKTVKLDPEQAAEEGLTALPPEAKQQAFTFTITAADGFHKSVYSYTRTNGDTSTTETAIVDGRSLTVTLKDGDTVMFDSLHVGAYTVTETYVPGFRSVVGNTIQQSVDVTVTEGNTTPVAFENQYPYYTGSLVVRKALTEGSADNAGSYTVRVTLYPEKTAREVERKITVAGSNTLSCTIPAWVEGGENQTEFAFNIAVPAGTGETPGSVELQGVPVGSFTVEELPRAATGNITDYYTVHYDYALHQNDEKNNEPGFLVTGNIHGGHPTAVTFRNTPKTGGLNLEKTVTQEYAGDSFESGTFSFTVTGYSELPADTYSVSNGAYTATVGEDGSVTVKDASGNDPKITVTKGETGMSWTQTLALTGLPAGKYTVTEADAPGYTCEEGTKSNLQVGGTDAPRAAFTNTFKRTSGNLTVSKTIELTENETGATINEDKEFEFTLLLKDGTLSGSYATTDGKTLTVEMDANRQAYLTFALKHDEAITIKGLPVGQYELREKSETGYQCSFESDATDKTYCAEAVTITTGETKSVACTNRYPVYDATLVVKKQVVTPEDYSTIDQAPEDDEFTFEVVIEDYDTTLVLNAFVSGVFYTANGSQLATQPVITCQALEGGKYKLTFTLKNGQYVRLHLPVCDFTVAETGVTSTAHPDDALADHYTTTCVVSGTNGVQTEGAYSAERNYPLQAGATVTAAFTNTYKRHYADLTIVTQANYTGQNFIFDVESVADDTFKLQVILGSNDSRTIKDLPVGRYTVTEQDAWSWRENALTAWSVAPTNAGTTACLSPVTLENGSVTVTFNYGTVDRQQWLSGYSYNIGKEG